MSDVVAVALISAGSSLLGASVGALTTYKVSLRNAQTTVATATGQHEVEMARIEAENQRLQQNNQEEERRNRQSTYHQYLNTLIGFFQVMDAPASPETVNKMTEEYLHLHAGVVLFAPSSVRKAAYEVAGVYNELRATLQKQRDEHPDKSEPEYWRAASAEHKKKFGEQIVEVTSLMHADVTRGITEDPADRPKPQSSD
jgi:Sec-independent protein translocase protein TatA